MKPFIAHLFIWLWNGAIFLSIICPILFGLWYREQRIQVGYCGHEKPLKSLAISAFPQTERVDSVLQAYRPNCLECPEHGICSSFMNVECEPGYEPKSSILETYGIIPFPKYCAKDESKEKEVDELVWKVNEYLKRRMHNMNVVKERISLRVVKRKPSYMIYSLIPDRHGKVKGNSMIIGKMCLKY